MSVNRIGTRVAFGVALLSACLTSSLWGQSQGEMNDEAYAKFQKADAKLNATYKEIFRLYDDDPAFLKHLRNAQRKWIESRDSQLEARFPKDRGYGSVTPLGRFALLEQLTRDRTAQLQEWLDGVDNHEACAGTIKTKEELAKARKAKAQPASPGPAQDDSESLFPAVEPSIVYLNPKHTPTP